ncbi:hypothetical protein [Maribacter litoralis]|uniref:Uncharacterized protein n=1 Tax=Maribacter litoralis TaxID=2059726 RepID=A0A653QDB7_9FLAO|nr:hypothetical protein [Maribacter litoralis]VXB40153.1 conserved hypothetical protein [Maribacter litoralis]
MQFIARFTLLFFWLFAITAPSIITLCDVDNPIVITNLNEEEQESGKKSMGEEKFVKDNSIHFSFISIHENSIIGNMNTIGYLDLYLEVFSPPPDYIS